MLQAFSLFAEIVAVFLVLDLIVSDRHKDIISQYVFGIREVNISNFEHHVSTSLIRFFLKNEKLHIFRILQYSILLSIIGMIDIYIFADGAISSDVFIHFSNFLFSILGGLGSFIFDYFSIFITKSLFYRKNPISIFHFIRLFFSDIFISLLFYVVIFIVAYSNRHNLLDLTQQFLSVTNVSAYVPIEYIIGPILIGFFVSIISSILINIAQFFIIITGFLIRFVTKYQKIGQFIVLNSNLESHPFAFIGAVFGFFISMAIYY